MAADGVGSAGVAACGVALAAVPPVAAMLCCEQLHVKNPAAGGGCNCERLRMRSLATSTR
jgi:hypothetical protein